MRKNLNEKSLLGWLAVASAVTALPGFVASANATAYVWTGAVGNGIWGQAAASQGNWLDDLGNPVYTPSNGGGHTFTFAAAGYNASATTITLENHNPNVNNMTLNGTLVAPLKFVVDGGNANNHIDFAPATSGAETLTVNSTGHEIASINGGGVVLQGTDENAWRISGSAVFTVSAPISGSGNNRTISKRGGGTLRLTGLNTFGGVITAGDGTIEINSLADRGVASAAGTGVGSADGMIQISRTTSASHLNGTLIYTGADASSNRAIRIAKDTSETPGTDTAKFMTTGGTLTLTGGITATAGGLLDHFVDFSVGGAGNMVVGEKGVFGDINLIKTGAGRVEINADSLWRGATTVSQGTLLINASHTVLGGGAYTVRNGGTLGGIGAIAAPITVEAGGTLRPGDAGSAGGTLDVSAVSLDGQFQVDLFANGAAGQVVSSGAFTLADTASLAIVAGSSLPTGTLYTIIDTAGLLSGTFDGLSEGSRFTAGSNTFEISYAGGDVTLTVVPEPTAIAAVSVAGLALLRRRRRSCCI